MKSFKFYKIATKPGAKTKRNNMSRKSDVIPILLSVTAIGCYIGSCYGRNLTQCEFIDEFRKYSPQISHDDLNKWTCIVEHSSNFSTQKNVDDSGITSYGLFQLNDRYFCERNAGDHRICDVPCLKFDDEFFGDDIQCAQKIYETHLQLFGSGFGAWPLSNVNCIQPKNYVKECGKETSPTDNITTSNRFGIGVVPRKYKIYERCELARELRFTHNFPMEQIHTWLCSKSNCVESSQAPVMS